MSQLEKISKACKEYYMNKDIAEGVFPINHKLASLVASTKVNSVMEFGCNDGRNLKIIKSMRPNMLFAGIDINTKAIAKAVAAEFGVFAIGDEGGLKHVQTKSYGTVFTNSVLDHIPKINHILKQFRRIARTSIILCETQEVLNKYYFAHDYKGFGFTKIHEMKSVSQPLGNGALYEFWKLDFQ